MEQNSIVVKNVTKKFDDFMLDHISFTVPTGRIVGFIGENGAGKSTLIDAVGYLGFLVRECVKFQWPRSP